MSFIWPSMLFSLLLVPLIGGAYLLLQRRRQRTLAAYGNFGFSQGAGGRKPGIRRHIPIALFMTGLIILLVALARPRTVINLPRQEGTVILVFDVSGSMAAEDLKPTRMEAAKAAAINFIQRQPSSVQIGVVAFSDGGLAVQTPTNDQEVLLASINRLTPQLGTSLGHGILSALEVLEMDSQGDSNPNGELEETPVQSAEQESISPSAAIVLLTDGENTAPPDPLEAALAAAERGVRIYTIGIGSLTGTTLEVNGFTVHTQLYEEPLQQISQLTEGTYYFAGNEQDLQTIYESLVPQWVVKPEKMEITSILAGASLFILLLGAMFSMLWFNRVP